MSTFSFKILQLASGAILGIVLVVGISLSPIFYSKPVPASSAKIDTIILEHRDTLVRLDTIRKTRIKYIDTSKIVVVHDMLDSLVPIDTADNDGNQMIAANQLREALRWKDSLNTCLDMRKVDSIALDTMSKIARAKPDTVIEKPSITGRLKDFGAGLLVGAGLRSFW